jgi:uncharacterized protein YndB with AHSA1/START domain
MVGFGAERVIAAPQAAVWELVTDPTRFPEWFDSVDEAEADGEPGRGQTHVVRGPWGEQRFEIERVVESWVPGRHVGWRDVAERLDGRVPEDMWHQESGLAVTLEERSEGTWVQLSGQQLPASEVWRERLMASVPMIEARLEASLERLAALLEG